MATPAIKYPNSSDRPAQRVDQPGPASILPAKKQGNFYRFSSYTNPALDLLTGSDRSVSGIGKDFGSIKISYRERNARTPLPWKAERVQFIINLVETINTYAESLAEPKPPRESGIFEKPVSEQQVLDAMRRLPLFVLGPSAQHGKSEVLAPLFIISAHAPSPEVRKEAYQIFRDVALLQDFTGR